MKIKFLHIMAFGAMLFSTNAYAQNGFYNVGKLTISSNTKLSIKGNLTNKGEIKNPSGNISLDGNWDNQGTYNQGTGNTDRVDLIQTGETSVKGNQTFYDISITSGNQVSIEGNTTISGNLVLSGNKNLIINDEAKLSLGKNSVIENDSQDSYIEGKLYRTGKQNSIFPIGTPDRYMPVRIVGTDTSYTLSFKAQSGKLRDQDQLISDVGYWEKELVNGQLNSSYIKLSYNESIKIGNTSDASNFAVLELKNKDIPSYTNLGQAEIEQDVILSKEFMNNGNAYYTVGIQSLKPFYIPNTLILSDANEENRAIRIYGNELLSEGFIFKVFDKWGTLLFTAPSLDAMRGNNKSSNNESAKSSDRGWKGEADSGAVLESDTYTYILKAKKIDGSNFSKTGSILLIR